MDLFNKVQRTNDEQHKLPGDGVLYNHTGATCLIVSSRVVPRQANQDWDICCRSGLDADTARTCGLLSFTPLKAVLNTMRLAAAFMVACRAVYYWQEWFGVSPQSPGCGLRGFCSMDGMSHWGLLILCPCIVPVRLRPYHALMCGISSDVMNDSATWYSSAATTSESSCHPVSLAWAGSI
jgi:hypothetical protein